ncbi:hypothetical protein P4O66_003881 [Electrophorus voltai]|uniref:LRRNT domain-containing protein n=1 Tax=Electrophorus voltai TaxID=2609070 RepID=A0AAD8ZSP6_9TELE|nr:hypothetical protein P4O66_003881 [Electrophorus voltai]
MLMSGGRTSNRACPSTRARSLAVLPCALAQAPAHPGRAKRAACRPLAFRRPRDADCHDSGLTLTRCTDKAPLRRAADIFFPTPFSFRPFPKFSRLPSVSAADTMAPIAQEKRSVSPWGISALLCGLLCFVAVNGCPHKCSCSGSHVDCQGQGFRTVPRGIPRNAERFLSVRVCASVCACVCVCVDLDRNNITRITKVDFSGLKNLRVLHLENNQISVIERGAFQDLKQLERLRLNRNRLQVLPELLFQSTPKLGRL